MIFIVVGGRVWSVNSAGELVSFLGVLPEGCAIIVASSDDLSSVVLPKKYFSVGVGQAVLASIVLSDLGFVSNVSVLANSFVGLVQLGDYSLLCVADAGLFGDTKALNSSGWNVNKFKRLIGVLAEKNNCNIDDILVCGCEINNDYSPLYIGINRLAKRYNIDINLDVAVDKNEEKINQKVEVIEDNFGSGV